MKNSFYLLFTIFLIFAAVGIFDEAHAVRLKFPHNVEGEIIAIDLEKEKPIITVEYIYLDKYYREETKQMRLRLTLDTEILDTEGKEVQTKDLKVGDTVSISYKVRYVGDGTPLWKDAQTITVEQTVEAIDKK